MKVSELIKLLQSADAKSDVVMLDGDIELSITGVLVFNGYVALVDSPEQYFDRED